MVKEVLFLRHVQDFIKPSLNIGAANVFENYEGAMELAMDKHASRRTKHIDVNHHLVRDACDAGKVKVVCIRTEDQHADLFTKSLGMQKFYKHAKTVLVVV